MPSVSDERSLVLQRTLDFFHGEPWEDKDGVTHYGPETTAHEVETVVEWTETHKERVRGGERISTHFVHPPHPCPEIAIPLDKQGSARGSADTSGARLLAKRRPYIEPSAPATIDFESAGREALERNRQWGKRNKQAAALTKALLRQQATALGL